MRQPGERQAGVTGTAECGGSDRLGVTVVGVSEGGASRRPLVQRGIEILASLLCLALALRGVDFSGLASALGEANYWWLIPAVCVTLALEALKAWRWQLLFLPERRLHYWSVFTALAAGYLASNVMPGRVGELLRLVLLSSEEKVSPARVVSTIVIERLYDILSLLLFFVCLVPFIAFELPGWLSTGAMMVGVMAMAAAGLMLVLAHSSVKVMATAHRWLGRLRWLDRPVIYSTLEHLLHGFNVLQGWRGIGMFLLSLGFWAPVTAVAWAAAQAFRLQLTLPAVGFAVVVTTLGMLLPSTPGYVGVFHYLVTVALVPFGVPRESAVSFALVWHAANYLTLTFVGALALWVHGTTLGEILRRREHVDPTAEQNCEG
jgi:glycosyltransferase 2 family protein